MIGLPKSNPAPSIVKEAPRKQRSLKIQFIRFGMVGTVGFAVNAGMVEMLNHYMGPMWSQALAFPTAVSMTWYLNRRYTFGASQYIWHREWLHYSVANAFGWIANNGIYLFLIFNLNQAHSHPSIAVAAGSLAGMVFNFIASKRIVFK